MTQEFGGPARPHLRVRDFPTLKPFHAGPHAHDPQGVLRLALSESGYGASPKAAAAAAAETSRLHLYPHSNGEPLRGALADHYGVPHEGVLVGNGLDELILVASLATVVDGRVGVTTATSFAGYAASMEIAGQPVTQVPLRDWATDVDAVSAAMEGAGCVMVCNPHNPAGSALSAAQVATLVERARATGAVLVLDEAYAEFADPDETTFGSGLRHLEGGSVVVLRTFSKAYGLAGVRVGYALGDPAVIDAMRAIRTALPYNTSRVALAAATAALGDQAFVRDVVDGNRRTRAALAAALGAMGVQALPSQTNFVLAQLGPDGTAVVARMARDHAVHVRDADGLGFPGWARISVPHERDLSRLIDALDHARTDAGDTDMEVEA